MENSNKTQGRYDTEKLSLDNWQKPGSECYMFATEQMLNNNSTSQETICMLVERGMNIVDAHALVSNIEDELKEVDNTNKDTNTTHIDGPSATIEPEENEMDVPSCLEKWNMGAFMIGGLWGICNRMWWIIGVALFLSFLSLVDNAIGLILSIILGVILGRKGNRMSWEQYKTDTGYTAEQFDKRQNGWNIAGWTIFAIALLIGFFSSLDT